jgi:hypothetical protein
MTAQRNTQRKGSLPRRHLFSLSAIALLVLAGVLLVLPTQGRERSAQAANTFSFSVAGDYGQTKNTNATLGKIGTLAQTSAVSFNLGLGDLNYDYPTVSAQQWSTYVQGYLPSDFPFELVAREYDTGDIGQLEGDLPDHIGNVSGTYGEEYYFDYPPPATPLARFIFVSPGVLSQYDYSKGGLITTGSPMQLMMHVVMSPAAAIR